MDLKRKRQNEQQHVYESFLCKCKLLVSLENISKANCV